MKRRHFRGDAAFANPEVHELLEAKGYKYSGCQPTRKKVRAFPPRGGCGQAEHSSTSCDLVTPIPHQDECFCGSAEFMECWYCDRSTRSLF